MNRKFKWLALILSFVLCMSVFTAFSAFAVEDEPVDNPETYETQYVPTETEYIPPETETQYVPPETYAPETYAPETYAPETEQQAQTDSESSYNDDSYDSDYSDGNSYEERENNTTNEKAETGAVYDAENDDVSTDTLKKSDWAKIAEQLKNANGDESDDFAFIRNNDPNGANNGEWMLILGIAMEALGIGTIITLIVMKVRRKKALESGKGGRPPRGGAPGRPANGRTAPRQTRRGEEAPRAQKYSKKQRSKFDTADVVIPKHARQSGGGKRYRPRH